MASKSNSFDSFEKAAWRDLPGVHKAVLVVMTLIMLTKVIFERPFFPIVFLALSLVVLFIVAQNILLGRGHSAFLVLALWFALGGFVLFKIMPFAALVTNFPWP